MDDGEAEQIVWESDRIEALGGGLIAAASAAGMGVCLVSMQNPRRVVYISDRGAEILGHARAEILSRPAVDFLAPDERATRDAIGPRVRDDARPQFTEVVVKRANGEEVPVEVAAAPIRLDGAPGLIALMRDVTKRRRSLEALERSERRFRQLIELAPDAVWINDGRRLLFANPTAARMLRYDSVEALLATDPREIVAPEDQAAMRERTQEMFRDGVPLPPRDYRTRRSDGTWVVTEVQSMPIEWEGAPAILGFARDVTGRREMEARLAQSERLAALGTLLAGIAHEMNNPLAYTLLGIEEAVAQVDRLAAPAEDVAKLRESLEGAIHGATRVAAIIGQIRASSRPEVEERGPVDLRGVLESALRVTHNELHHRARLVTSIGDVPAVLGSAQRLEQVFLNLLVNAVQALPDGRAENEIGVTLQATSKGEVVIEVSDNGPGIPAEVRSRIFDPFFTTKPVGLGLGLGLSICHGIVMHHGGTITVDSAPDRGSTFRVVLPALATAAAAGPGSPATPPAATGAPAGRRRVLVIDDEPALSTMIRRVLAKDCDVDLAGDAREGLRRLDGPDGYDVILCDLMMPDMTGMDLFAEVARRHPGIERRFVFMTGGAFTPRATEFLAQVENRRLEKPFETAVLKAIVARDD
ncbi:MAG TPA: PAS domain S-box protein [Polyangia bacterium]|jgi:PAS domain S-box-containing protein